nr:MAG: hypothetical protein DIU70_13890 [Bacillota bacterium]
MAENEGRIGVGTLVRWESHGAGWFKTKEGRVVAFVPAWADPVEACPELKAVPRSRIKFSLEPAAVDRYVVRVYRTSRRGGLDYYYGPRADVVERAMAEAEAESGRCSSIRGAFLHNDGSVSRGRANQ